MAEVKSQGAVEAMDVAEGVARDRVGKAVVRRRSFPRQAQSRSHPSRSPSSRPPTRRKPTTSSARLERFLAENVDADKIDEQGEYDYSLFDGFNRARRLGHEDPEGVRRPRIQRHELQPRHRPRGHVVRIDRGLALRASVDRRSAAAQALRHAGAEEEVPAASGQGRDLRVRADRAGRRIRSGQDGDDRGHVARRQGLDHQRREALVHERHEGRAARGDGADARRRSSRAKRRSRSRRSSSRRTRRASRSSIAASSWGCAASATR